MLKGASEINQGQLASAFRKLRGFREGSSWNTAHCPLHGDRIPSLGLSKKGVLQCFAGCKFVDLLAYFRDEYGVDVGTEEEDGVEAKDMDWKLVETYKYHDYAGRHVGTKHRYENGRAKRFDWEFHDKPLSEMPLWGWESINDRDTVFFVEGEKCTSWLISENLCAVSTGGGASSTVAESVLEPLRGKSVILWRDNDEPGLAWSLKLARQLWSIAKSVRIVNWADGGKGADAADYLDAGLPIEDILKARDVEAQFVDTDYIRVSVETDMGMCIFHFEDIFQKNSDTLECELTINVISQTGIDTPFVQRINILSGSARELLVRSLGKQFGTGVSVGGWTEVVSRAYSGFHHVRRNTPRTERLNVPVDFRQQWAVEGLMPLGEDSIVFGPEGSGKSLFTMIMALCVATGTPFGGKLPVLQGPVIYVDYERDQAKFESHLGRAARGFGIPPEKVPELPIFYWRADGIPFSEQAIEVRREVQRIGAQLVIIDSLGFAVGGDMFEPSAPIRLYKRRVGCTTLGVGQVPAADEEKLYGNKYWMYAPHGMVWQLKMWRDNHGTMNWKMINKKYSDGYEPKVYTFEVGFKDDRSIELRAT